MSGPLTEYLLNLEELAWEANGKGDVDFYSSYLTDDAVAVGSTGRYDKATVKADGRTFGVYAATVYVRRGGVWYSAFNQLTPQEGGA